MEGIYKVNMLPNDLCVEETIYQIADSLDNLNNIVDDVFSRLSTRIQKNVDRTKNLQQRIDVSKEKVNQISTMQNAIKVFSSAKYPSSIKYEHYKSFLDFDGYKYEPKKHILSNKAQKPPNEKELQEKLHFYHVKVGKPDYQIKNKTKITLKHALEKVSAVGDLLIFNTDESPYIQSQMKAATYGDQNKAHRVKSGSTLDAAPSSITNRGQVLKSDVDEYLYTPGMGDVPELEMPMDLPHLPGIAGDLQFFMVGDKAIAPSVVTSPTTIESLPEVVAAELPDIKLEEPVVLPDIPDAVIMTTPLVVALPVSVPPPPPPPPPPMDVEVVTNTTSNIRPVNPSPGPSSGDARFNLMAAIRSAGGAGKAKLKSTATSTPEKSSKAPTGGDLMADLHAKLSMRRKGISGAERGDTMLHTLANVIPEPGDQSSVTNSSGDEDWE